MRKTSKRARLLSSEEKLVKVRRRERAKGPNGLIKLASFIRVPVKQRIVTILCSCGHTWRCVARHRMRCPRCRIRARFNELTGANR